MRVALFFDGKNFYSGWKDAACSSPIDFVRLSGWLVERVGGSSLWSASYYTGIEPELPSESPSKLGPFLEMLELRPGFFVYRFPRKKRSKRCHACGAENHYTEEKEVDTTMVADMLRLAAVDAFDIMVLMSGDADLSPAVEGVRLLGKKAYVATWGKAGLSARLRKAAFGHIDLAAALDEFAMGQTDAGPARGSEDSEVVAPANMDASVDVEDGEEVFLDELKRAERKFSAGYVGVNYFVSSWRSDRLDPFPIVRRRLLNRLVEAGKIELYDAAKGDRAMRRKRRAP